MCYLSHAFISLSDVNLASFCQRLAALIAQKEKEEKCKASLVVATFALHHAPQVLNANDYCGWLLLVCCSNSRYRRRSLSVATWSQHFLFFSYNNMLPPFIAWLCISFLVSVTLLQLPLRCARYVQCNFLHAHAIQLKWDWMSSKLDQNGTCQPITDCLLSTEKTMEYSDNK